VSYSFYIFHFFYSCALHFLCLHDVLAQHFCIPRSCSSSTDPLREFEGYTNEKATGDKVLSDVFRKGDRYFRSGDLLRKDRQGFIYFVDRIGDTFRWKGENVATSEVRFTTLGLWL
jgi:hypothetical protein